MKVSIGDGPIDFGSARRFALVAALIKIICTLLLIITISIDTTSTGIDLHCPVDCDSPTALYSLNACCLRQEFAEQRRFNFLTWAFDLLVRTGFGLQHPLCGRTTLRLVHRRAPPCGCHIACLPATRARCGL